MEVETAIRRRHEEDRQRERFDSSENTKLVNDLEYVKKAKNEMEAELRSEVQRYRGDAEVSDRKLRTVTEELHNAQMKLKQTQSDLEMAQRKLASQMNDGSTTAAEKLIKTESELLANQRTKEQLEHQLQSQVDDLDTFKRQYDEQLKVWEREKAEAERRIHELVVANDKLRFENSEHLEAYKRKYNDYKGKLKRANTVIQTLKTSLAKYELQLQGAGVDSMRRIGGNYASDFSGQQPGIHHQQNSSGNVIGSKSAVSALSPVQHPYDNFMGEQYGQDIDNNELNEEIKKLLMENAT